MQPFKSQLCVFSGLLCNDIQCNYALIANLFCDFLACTFFQIAPQYFALYVFISVSNIRIEIQKKLWKHWAILARPHWIFAAHRIELDFFLQSRSFFFKFATKFEWILQSFFFLNLQTPAKHFSLSLAAACLRSRVQVQ